MAKLSTANTSLENPVLAESPSILAHEADINDVNRVINTYSAIASGAGLLPLPILDLVALGGIQMKMVYEIGKLHNYRFNSYDVKAAIAVLMSTIPAGALSRTTRSLLKSIPFVGPLLGGASGYLYSAASTYAIGKVFHMHFASGETLLTFNAEKMKSKFSEFFNEKFNSKRTTVVTEPIVTA